MFGGNFAFQIGFKKKYGLIAGSSFVSQILEH